MYPDAREYVDVLPYIAAYLYGSIPFSYLLPRLWKGVDVTKVGSKNVGASNAALATNSTLMFFVCLLLDGSKGFIPAYLWGPVVGAFGIVGHVFSIFLILFKFRLRRLVTGLGMSATVGYLLVIAPLMIPITLLVYALFLILSSPVSPARWYRMEEGNIATVFAIGPSALLYVIFFSPSPETVVGMLIIVFTVYIAYARRIRDQLREHWCFDHFK